MNKGKLHQNFYTAGRNNEQQKTSSKLSNKIPSDSIRAIELLQDGQSYYINIFQKGAVDRIGYIRLTK